MCNASLVHCERGLARVIASNDSNGHKKQFIRYRRIQWLWNIDGCTGITTINKKWLGHSSCCVCFSYSSPLSRSVCSFYFFAFIFRIPTLSFHYEQFRFRNERNTLHALAYTQLVIVHSFDVQCVGCSSFFFTIATIHAPLVRSRVMYYIFIFSLCFFCTVSLSFVSAIVNYVHNMYALMWVYGYGFTPLRVLFFARPTNMNVNCRKRKR